MVVLLFGPPGCGKGTQAAFLASRFQIPAISTGEMFRAECKAGTAVGRVACSILARGELVGDEMANDIVAGRTSRTDCAGGFVLDGYPRTVPQAAAFGSLLEQRGLAGPLVIHLRVPAEALIARLTSRRQCPKCLRIYNLLWHPPRREGVCDRDGAALITREDDREEVVRRRFRAYQDQTGPVLDCYPAAHTVDGTAAPEEVNRAVEALVRGASPARRLRAPIYRWM